MRTGVRYIIAFLVTAHGLVYFLTPLSSLSYTVFSGWRGSSALLGSGVSGAALKSVTSVLWLVAGVGILCAGLAILLISRFPHLWRPLALAATIAGMLSFVIFWDGQTAEFVNQGGIGLILSAVIFVGALAFPGSIAPSGGLQRTGEGS